MREKEPTVEQQVLDQERRKLLQKINTLTEKPMIALSMVWLGLLILDFTTGLSTTLQIITYLIWALFVLDFFIEILIAPRKGEYLRDHWLTAISLLLPALRVFRLFRALRILQAGRAGRPVSLIRLVTSLNRGMEAAGQTLGRRGVGYVVGMTVIVIFSGAAGMALFESPAALSQAGYGDAVEKGAGLKSYGEAVWWTAMIVTTMGSEYWPKTVEGRILCWLLAVYAFAVFGYVTAAIASYFVGKDTTAKGSEQAKEKKRD